MRAKVDLIIAVGPPVILAAKHATDTIPIVMAYWGAEGLIESGIVASFARPDGNVTGVYMLAAELDAKRLELLGLALDSDLHLNKTDKETAEEHDILDNTGLMATLRDHLSQDVALYERLLNRAWAGHRMTAVIPSHLRARERRADSHPRTSPP